MFFRARREARAWGIRASPRLRGADLKGLVLRVRNTGREGVALDENVLAARGVVSFMTPVSVLAPNQETAVYIIQGNGG